MDTDSPTGPELAALTREFLATPDWEATVRFADDHPVLRRPEVVARLYREADRAARAGRDDEADDLAAHALLLAGEAWTAGPPTTYTLVSARAALRDPAIDPVAVQRVRNAALRVAASDLSGVAHRDFLPRLIAEAAEICSSIYTITTDGTAIEEAVAIQRAAVETAHRSTLDARPLLNDLANMLGTLFEENSDRAALDEALEIQEQVVAATPEHAPQRGLYLGNLTLHLRLLYRATGERPVLDRALATQRLAIEATAPDSAEMPIQLGNLAALFAQVYELDNDRNVIDEAIAALRRAIAQAKDARAAAGLQTNLANLLAMQSGGTNDSDLLREAVAIQRSLVAALPPTAVERASQLNNLAGRLGDLHALIGDRSILDEALEAQRAALLVASASQVNRPILLHTLARILRLLYVETDDPAVLDEAVAAQRGAVDAADPEGPDLPKYLNNLAELLRDSYAAGRDRVLIDEALAIQREVVAATPLTNASRASRLDTFARCLGVMYGLTGDRSLLDEAVAAQREAVAITPSGSRPLAGRLTNLGAHLSTLYEATGDAGFVEEAIAALREAVDASTSDGSRGLRLHNLATLVADAYVVSGDQAVLEEALALQRRAVELTASSGIEHLARRNNLALRLRDLFSATGDLGLIEEAVTILREVVAATSPSSTERLSRANNLAAIHCDLYEATGERHHLDSAAAALSAITAEEVDHAGPWERAVLGRTKADVARLRGDGDEAADHLTTVLRVFDDEIERLGDDLLGRRDLAGRLDGVLGDLFTLHAMNEQPRRATQLIESDRMMLGAPRDADALKDEETVPVIWVAAGSWATGVVTATGRGVFTSSVVDVTREEAGEAVVALLNAARSGTPPARRKATDALCAIASRVISPFVPRSGRLLLVPVGVLSMLPYNAATHPAGGYVVDHVAVSVAPSLAWAHAVHRPPPSGARVGIFHGSDGSGPLPALDLDDDRTMFAQLMPPGAILDSPTSIEALAWLGTGTPLAHISCHGTYDSINPLASSLHLRTPLSLGTMLQRRAGPWLVNLSACETALPDMRCLEQTISFPTGFLQGGSAHVLATQWSVSARYATAVSEAFYREIDENRHPAEALREAIAHTRRTATASADPSRALSLADAIDHPFRWAPFVHHGSPW